MPGFPSRISRNSLGPQLVDKWPVVNPQHDVGEAPLNLAWWQVAGMNLTAPRGLMFVDIDEGAGTATTVYQGFAWDPNGSMPLVTWSRGSAGLYTFALPDTQYPDERGNMVTVDFLGGQVIPQGLFSGSIPLGSFEKTAARAGTARIYVPALTGNRDLDFLLLLW